MNFDTLPYHWMDLMTLVVLFVGILSGRKHGLSQELLGTLQWVTIVVAGGTCYRTVANFLAQTPLLSRSSYNLAAYVLIALATKLVFSFLKRHLGDKIVGADLFGRFEYYLGMLAGTVRSFCVYLFVLSLLHAPFYSPEMLVANAKSQEKNFGDVRFPTLGSIQHTVFKESATGCVVDHYLEPVLIEPVPPQTPDLRDANSLARRRERAIDSVLDGK